MKTNVMTLKSNDETLSVEACKLERLKMAGAYAAAPQAEAWAEGLTALQREVGCAVARRPRRVRLRHRPRLPAGRE